MSFPTDFPAGCPLPSAQDCSGLVYIVCPVDPVRDEDCLSQAERGKATHAAGDAACLRHGLSVFMDYEACVHQRTLFPRLGDYIARATLDASHGKALHTPARVNPGHTTWWPHAALSRGALFAIVEES